LKIEAAMFCYSFVYVNKKQYVFCFVHFYAFSTSRVMQFFLNECLLLLSLSVAAVDSQQDDVDLLNIAPRHKPQSNVDLLGGFAQSASTAGFGGGGSELEDLLQGGQQNNLSQQSENPDLLFDPFGVTSSQV
jgi:hypothetical protein